MDTADAGLTQVLAAGPELIRRWEHADATDPRQCCGKAVITAALDARRVGAQAPVTLEFLIAAAPGYLSSAQQAAAGLDWFQIAITYATTQLHGAAACLRPVAAGMGELAGYLTADYLHQHATRTRRRIVLPEPVWQALVDHYPDDSFVLAEHARREDQYRYAAFFYRRLAESGDGYAAHRWADLLVQQGQVEEAIVVLRPQADAGHWYARQRLVDLLAMGEL